MTMPSKSAARSTGRRSVKPWAASASTSSGWQNTGRSLGSSSAAAVVEVVAVQVRDQHRVEPGDHDLGRLGQLDERVAAVVLRPLDGRAGARRIEHRVDEQVAAAELEPHGGVADQAQMHRCVQPYPAMREYYESVWAAQPEDPRAVGVAAPPGAAAARGAARRARARPRLRRRALRRRAARRGRRSRRRRARRGGARARARATRRAPTCGWVAPDGGLPLGHGEVDLVWCSEVLEHVPDTVGFLSEVRRVLRPGGRLLLTVPDHGRVKRALIALAALRRALRPARRAPALLHAPLARARARGDGLHRRRSRRSAGRRCCASRSSRAPHGPSGRGWPRPRRGSPRAGPRSTPGCAGRGSSRAERVEGVGGLVERRELEAAEPAPGLGVRGLELARACSSAASASASRPRCSSIRRAPTAARGESGLRRARSRRFDGGVELRPSPAARSRRRRRGRRGRAGRRSSAADQREREHAAGGDAPRSGGTRFGDAAPPAACGHGAAARRAAAPRGVLEPPRSGPRPATQAAASSAHRVGRHEPRPVDRRVHAEHERDGDQRHQPDALGVPRQAAVARAQRRSRAPRDQPQRRAPAATARARPSRGRRASATHVAVRVAHEQRVVAEAGAHGGVGAGAGADQRRDAVDVERLVPVARAHRRGRRQAAGRVGGRRARSGSVSWSHALEIWPSIPPSAAGERDQRDDRDEREHAEQRAAGEPLRLRATAGARGHEARSPGRRPAAAPPSARAARRARGRRRRARRAATRSSVSPSCENAQATTGAAPAIAPSSTIAPRSRSGTTANQSGEPERERQQRAARVGQHQRRRAAGDRRARRAR